MQIKTWFGIISTDGSSVAHVELFKKDINTLIEQLADEPLLMRGNAAGEDIREIAVRYGFVDSLQEYDRILHEVTLGLAQKKVELSVTPDSRIIAAVEAIDDLNITTNMLSERLREWCISYQINIQLKGEELAQSLSGLKTDGKIPEPDLMMIRNFASGITGLYDARSSIEDYIKENMPVTAPNLTGIAGHILGARLLSIAGSLDKLASMPASTVQVIGACNALFKHLKGKASSPKHGIIFRHPLVNTAPKHLRGKIARALAAMISIAARCDRFSGDLNESLFKELNAKIENIKKNDPVARKNKIKGTKRSNC